MCTKIIASRSSVSSASNNSSVSSVSVEQSEWQQVGAVTRALICGIEWKKLQAAASPPTGEPRSQRY
jgi:hypothetical protein